MRELADPPVIKTEIEILRVIQVLNARHRDVLQTFHVTFLEFLELSIRWELMVQFPHQLFPSDLVFYFFLYHTNSKLVQN